MPQFIISVTSKDRTGIVADVTAAIKNLNGNLEDMSQTVMRGYFTMMLLAQFNDDVTEQKLKEALQNQSALAGLRITAEAFVPEDSSVSKDTEDSVYVLTSSGPDTPGLVALISETLREKDINIIDLNTRASEGKYNMMYLLDIPTDTDIGKLKKSFQVLMADLGLNVEIRHQSLFRKTNEI